MVHQTIELQTWRLVMFSSLDVSQISQAYLTSRGGCPSPLDILEPLTPTLGVASNHLHSSRMLSKMFLNGPLLSSTGVCLWNALTRNKLCFQVFAVCPSHRKVACPLLPVLRLSGCFVFVLQD